MRQCMDADNLHRRLKKIVGQVQAIDRMVDEDVPCEDVLSQINAAKSALHKCGAGGAGGAHPALCPGRHPARGCGQDHRELHQGGGAVLQHGLKARDRLKSRSPLYMLQDFLQSVIGQYLSAAGHLLFPLYRIAPAEEEGQGGLGGVDSDGVHPNSRQWASSASHRAAAMPCPWQSHRTNRWSR